MFGFEFVQYVPSSGFVGIDSFEYSVNDSGGLTDTATVFITVNQVEEPEEPEEPQVPSGGGGVSTPSGPSTDRPIADASAGEPYQGFVDEEGVFYTRDQAEEVVRMNGQLKRPFISGVLTSEDLW